MENRDIPKRNGISELTSIGRERSYTIINAMLDGVGWFDANGVLIDCNPALCQMTGFSREELIGCGEPRPYWPLEEYQNIHNVLQRSMQGEVGDYELTFMRKNGERFPAISSVCWLKHGDTVSCFAVVKDITELKRLRESMQFYISQTTRAREEERKRIARDLHDETLQSLASLCLEIEAIISGKELSQIDIQKLIELQDRVRSIMQGVRHFCHELRPDILDRLGLVSAIELLTNELNNKMKINVDIEVSGEEQRLSGEEELVLFRIAQEALNNVWRHSQATEVLIRLKFSSSEVELIITDNGSGFKLPKVVSYLANEGKLGLIDMQERARLIRARFSVTSKIGTGTKVAIKIKL
ncbi:PAS domain S-box protein, partial [Chloroflexota bacterium]